MFIKIQNHKKTFVFVYVDDILLTGDDDKGIHNIKLLLNQNFKMKELGPLTYFLGLDIYSSSNGCMVNQDKYTQDIITLASLSDHKHVDTHLEINVSTLKMRVLTFLILPFLDSLW